MTLLKSLRNLLKYRHLGRGAVDTHYALIEACLIGLVSAFAALFLKQGIGWVGGYRIQAAHKFSAGFALPIFGLILGIVAGWFIEQFSPEAASGGIPRVKAVLARFPLPLSARVAIVKEIGTILVLGSGLTLGRRGPTVHIGAALAAQLSKWVPTSPEHRRQMIAAGAAAGLAAGFNTPIAGVLFVVEELMRDISGLTLEVAILASFTGAVVSRMLGAASLTDSPGLLDVSFPIMVNAPVERSFSASEIPFYIILGILAGILGGIFNRGILAILSLNRSLGLGLPWRVGLAGIISGSIISFLPPIFWDNAGLREFLMGGKAEWEITAIAFVAHFFLTLLAYGSGAPGGLFAPALVLGSALGYLVGMAEVFFLGTGLANTYALAGMGAFFTAVVRVPVTAIVIVFEMTTDFNLVLPLMISSAVAYIFAESVSRGSLYQHLLEASGIQIKDDTPNEGILTALTASDVMQSQVETLSTDLTLDQVLEAMSLSSHRGFPVVSKGKLVGLVTQSDLAKVSNNSGDILLSKFMTPKPITVEPTASLSDVLYLLNRFQLSRLPVTEGNKLLGIITRTDIIRAEVNQLSGHHSQTASKPAPSYIVYQTRCPALGKGRILLPISNPKTASALLQIGAAIARREHYELECLQIIKIPKHSKPDQTEVYSSNGRKLMRRLERLARKFQISVHTQVLVSQDTTEAILETIQRRHIKLVLMGWKGKTSTQGAIFGNVADTLIRKAPCDLVLVKLGKQKNSYPNSLNHNTSWLIPMAGGPNAQRAIKFLPALTGLYNSPNSPKVWLCQVHRPSQSDPIWDEIEEAAYSLRSELSSPITPICVRSYSVSDALIHLATAERCDVVMLGASREGLLQQAIHGNIPEAIALGVKSTVIIVRGAID
ncbi:MAG: CBS domain-containing protein [Moorea sp. SIO2B7]|nr:CBS domain-containing protein [Moorena sp. SIO2B7]